MRHVTRTVLGITLTGALLIAPQNAFAAQPSDSELEAIAAEAMTPLPPALRTDGDVTTTVTADSNPDRGLDMCINKDGSGLYLLPPKSAIKSTNDVRTANGDTSNETLTETTVEIARYGSVKEAKKIWMRTVRVLRSKCAGAILVPTWKRTFDDGTQALWTSAEFNEVTVTSAASGPVGLLTAFVNYESAVEDPTTVTSSWMIQQYSSWRLAGNTIVRAEFAKLWQPASSGAPNDPSAPAITDRMEKAVDRMARQTARAVAGS